MVYLMIFWSGLEMWDIASNCLIHFKIPIKQSTYFQRFVNRIFLWPMLLQIINFPQFFLQRKPKLTDCSLKLNHNFIFLWISLKTCFPSFIVQFVQTVKPNMNVIEIFNWLYIAKRRCGIQHLFQNIHKTRRTARDFKLS